MKIVVSSLTDGFQELDFEETAGQLQVENPVLFPNPVVSHLEIEKTETHIYVKAALRTVAHFTCDRCLKGFDQTITGNYRLYFEILAAGNRSHLIDEDEQTLDDSIRVYHPHEREIDLSQDIRDTLLLMVPMKTVCSPDCKGICPGCGRDLNVEKCTCSQKQIDPRWEKLQNLLNEMEEK